MRTLLWSTIASVAAACWLGNAIAQEKPSNPSLIENQSNSGASSGKNGVDDRTGNANTMNSQGSTSTSGTVRSSVVPPVSSNNARNPSGSGSTSGGVDYNGDKGADRMKR